MALSEVRAAWQRTANRCFVQEDAKRAPKLACCPTVPSSIKQAHTGPTSVSGGEDVPSTIYVPANLNISYSNLSPSSKWWLYVQPNSGYQKDLMDDQFNSVEGSMETCQMDDISGTHARSAEDPAGLIGQTITKNLSCGKTEFGVKEEEFVTFPTWNCQDPLKVEVKEDVRKLNIEDSKSSWIEVDKNIPWWRTADMDELASFVARSSLDHIENCDLPRPQNAHLKKDVDSISCSAHNGIPGSLPDPKLTHLHTGSVCQKLEGHSVSSADMTSRDIPTHERMVEMDTSKAELMEALRHSQTRAREAEIAANQACAEKEHVVKLVFRQASQLFAYKQWLQLLQLETMYLQFINNTSQSVSMVLPSMSPWTPQRSRKIRKNSDTSSSRKRACPQYDASKYAVVLALGLGLAGAGFLLGWTIGWMLPTW